MKGIHWIVIVAIIAVTILTAMKMEQEETVAEKVGESIESIGESIEDAAQQPNLN